MNKNRLLENIMAGVSKGLKNAFVINEEFSFEDTEIADKLLELVKRDKQIQTVVALAKPEDWAAVLRGMVKLINSKNIPENPMKIANIVQLATAILQRGFDSKLQQKLVEMPNEDITYTANFLSQEVKKFAKPAEKPALNGKAGDGEETINDNKNEGENKNDDSKKNEGQCDDKQNKGKVNESRRNAPYRLTKKEGGFSKFLNENHYNIRPGRK